LRILFCFTSSSLFLIKAKPLAVRLKDAGHVVKAITFHGDEVSDHFPVETCEWPHFEMGPIHKFNPDLIIVWNGFFSYYHAAVMHLKSLYPV